MRKRYYLGPTYPNVYLTHREAQCVAYFLEGYSNGQVGAALNLSPRTVDFYTVEIRRKLGCSTKADLVEKIKETRFMQYIKELLITESEGRSEKEV